MVSGVAVRWTLGEDISAFNCRRWLIALGR